MSYRYLKQLIIVCMIITTIWLTPSFAETQTSIASVGSITEEMQKTDLMIDCGELPADGTPIVVRYYFDNEKERANNSYIVFSITRTSVLWTCVLVPSNWGFRGSMSIVNLTTGMYSGQNILMAGRSGTVGYYGLAGHSYRMSFSGLFYIVDTDGKIIAPAQSEYENGSCMWTVPFE